MSKFRVLLLVLMTVVLVACGDNDEVPKSVAKSFMEAMIGGDGDKVMDLIYTPPEAKTLMEKNAEMKKEIEDTVRAKVESSTAKESGAEVAIEGLEYNKYKTSADAIVTLSFRENGRSDAYTLSLINTDNGWKVNDDSLWAKYDDLFLKEVANNFINAYLDEDVEEIMNLIYIPLEVKDVLNNNPFLKKVIEKDISGEFNNLQEEIEKSVIKEKVMKNPEFNNDKTKAYMEIITIYQKDDIDESKGSQDFIKTNSGWKIDREFWTWSDYEALPFIKCC